MRRFRLLLSSFCALGLLSFLGGCSSSFAPGTDPSASPIGEIKGVVHGGQQPIMGMHLYLYAAGTSGYGAAATSLLTNVAGKTTSDGTNYYVTTDSNGNFSVTGDYSCVSGTQVYLYGVGGNPGGGTNTAAGMLAVLGQCPSTGTLSQQVPYVFMDEVTTVAAAYALAAYAVDPTHVGTANTVQGVTGMANAFANASNLANLSNGQAVTTTAFGNGTAPQAEINTLGNILASCVNSTGTGSLQCSLLFLAAQSAPSGGTQPTDTAAAAMNIAHNPGTNVNSIYILQPATGAPFQPSLAAAPNDFTVALKFTGGGLAAAPALAVDTAGAVWTGSPTVAALAKFSPFGNSLSGSSGYATYGSCRPSTLAVRTDGSIESFSSNTCLSLNLSTGTATNGRNIGTPSPSSLALDAANNGYSIADSGVGYGPLVVSSDYSYIGGFGGYTVGASPYAVALDGSQNIWATSFSGRLDEFSPGAPSGGQLSSSSGITGGGLSAPTSLAIDHSGNVWTSNSGNNSISEFNQSRTAVSGSSGYTGGGLSYPSAVAVDGLGRVWTSNKNGNSLSEFSSTGTAISPSTGYSSISGTLASPNTLVIDPSGNIWVGSTTTATLAEFVGAAAPVVTPMVTAVANNTLGTRP